MKKPKYERQTICAKCGLREGAVAHGKNDYAKKYGHHFVARLESDVEAAYRQGYEDGANKTADRIHWGLGWD